MGSQVGSPATNFSCALVKVSAFFFQAEDGIRDTSVTGVQTCALPISQWLVYSVRGIGCTLRWHTLAACRARCGLGGNKPPGFVQSRYPGPACLPLLRFRAGTLQQLGALRYFRRSRTYLCGHWARRGSL